MHSQEIPSTMPNEQLGIVDILQHGARWNAASQVFSVRDGGSIDARSFAEVGVLAARLANALASIGITRGNRVASYMWNNLEHLAAYLAVPAMGAILHTANIRLDTDQNVFVTNAAGDRAIIVDESLLHSLLPGLSRMKSVETVIVNGNGDLDAIKSAGKTAMRLSDLMQRADATYEWPEADERAACSICFTTGTTGDPKGVVYSHRSTWLHAMSVCTANALRIGADDRVLVAVPMFHANGWGYPYAAFWSGADLVLPGQDLRPAQLVELISEFRITFANGVPTLWKDVLRHLEDAPDADLSSLDRLVMGGSAVAPSLIEEWATRHKVGVVQGWGMTETSPLVTTARPPRSAAEREVLDYQSSQGRVLPGVRVRLMDPESGHELPADGVAVGEIELRGPWITTSYLAGSDPEKFRDGWLRTGDVGTLDSMGYVRLTDRAKDVIKSGGEWISSVALESELSAHPDVADVAVIGVPDERWDERPLVLMVRRGETASFEEIRGWLADRVPRWWLPERWSTIDALPRTSVGKIDKKAIRQLYAAEGLEVRNLGTAPKP